MAVGTHLLVDEALTSTAWPQFDYITILLYEGYEPQYVMQLLALRVGRVGWLIAHRAQQQIQPLVPSEVFTPSNEIVDVAAGELDRADVLNPEGAVLVPKDKRVVVAQGNLSPDATHKQAVVTADLALLNV